MEKVKSIVRTIASIRVEIKKSDNAFVNPAVSYLLVLLGAVQLLKCLKYQYFKLLLP